MDTPAYCPNCGAAVEDGAKSCPECGSCHETGWSDKAAYDAIGVPTEEFDYDGFVQEEFGGRKPKRSMLRRWGWVIVAAILLALVCMGLLF